MGAYKPLRPGNRRGAATAVALLARNGAGRRRTAPAWFAPTRSGRSCQADSAALFSIKGGRGSLPTTTVQLRTFHFVTKPFLTQGSWRANASAAALSP